MHWARRTSWGWWDDWDDTVLQTQDSKFEPWPSEAEHATPLSLRLSTILTFTRGLRKNIFCYFQTAETGNRTPNSGVKGSGANHYPRIGYDTMQCQVENRTKIHIRILVTHHLAKTCNKYYFESIMHHKRNIEHQLRIHAKLTSLMYW